MSPLFGKRCPKCNHENNSDANFCINCGTPLSGSKGKKCGACGAENRYDAVYCKECGRNLSVNERIEIRGNHWARRDGDFAARLEIDDLPGLLNRKLEVETGTRALIYTSGSPQEILLPGIYTMDSVGKTISNWFNAVPKSVSVLLVDAAPVEVVIRIAKRFTSDPLPINLNIHLVVEIENVSTFLQTALKNRERYSVEDLRLDLEPEIAAATDDYLRHHTFEQLLQNSHTREELELAVEEGLRTTFSRYGLKLVSLRTVELDLEAFDKVRGITGNYSLLIDEAQAKLSGEQRMLEFQKQIDLHDVASRTATVEKEERLAELYQRIRQNVNSDKMNEVRSGADFEKFMDEIDRQKLLSKKEREDLIRGWTEEAEDHNRARAFLLAKTEVEEKFQLRAIEIKSNGEIDLQEQEYRLELERQRTDKNLQIEQKKWEWDLKKRQDTAEWENQVWETENRHKLTESDQDWNEMTRMVELKLNKDRQEAILQNDKETWALERRLDEARRNVDIEISRMDADHRREMERLEKLATLGTEALIAASPAEQGRILQDLKRTEYFKSMSEEQILAMAAEKSPELGKVFEEKYRAIAEGKTDRRESEMYEKLLSESKSSQSLLIETQKDAMNRIQQMAEQNITAMKEISEAYAKHGADPVIIAGAAGNSMFRASHSGISDFQEETKICPGCGRQVTVSSRFCQYCNNEFKDIK